MSKSNEIIKRNKLPEVWKLLPDGSKFMQPDGREFPISKKKSGIYKITTPTNKVYFEKSTDLYKSVQDCSNDIDPFQRKIKSSFKCHGLNKHKFDIIELCNEDELEDKKNYYIELYKQNTIIINIKLITGIYKITCKKTGKIYIGQTIHCDKRKSVYTHERCRSQLLIYRSIKKYGWDNHTFEIIERCERKMLNHWEKYYIWLYDTFDTEHGLNLADGGGTFKMSREVRSRMSKNMIGNTNGARELKAGRRNYDLLRTRKEVCQFDKQGNYIKTHKNISQAVKETGCQNILVCVNNKRPTSGGYIWQYRKDVIDLKLPEDKIKRALKYIPKTKRKIIQYTLQGDFVKIWDGEIEIRKSLGAKNIRAVCVGKQYKCYGYMWRYWKEYFPMKLSYEDLSKLLPVDKTRPVHQYDVNCNYITTYNSIEEAVIAVKGKYEDNCIKTCCKGGCNTWGGYIWRYLHGDRPTKPVKLRFNKIVLQCDINGNVIKEWNLLKDIFKALNIRGNTIKKYCNTQKTYKGFLWVYKSEQPKSIAA